MRLLSPTANRSGENDPDYDLIPLYGCGLVTHWRFPDILHCPFIRCDVTFNDRLAGIDHYKENHTKKATLCPLCKPPKPITGLRNTFIEHCESKHPNEELPYNFSKKQYKRQSNVIANFCTLMLELISVCSTFFNGFVLSNSLRRTKVIMRKTIQFRCTERIK